MSTIRLPPYRVVTNTVRGRLFAALRRSDAPPARRAWHAARRAQHPRMSGATTAKNCPSLAMCSGSSPSSSQAPRTLSLNRNLFLLQDRFPSRNRAPVRSAMWQRRRAWDRASSERPAPSFAARPHQWQHGARIGRRSGFQIQFAAGQQNGDAVVADGAGEQNLVAGPYGPGDISTPRSAADSGGRDVHAVGFAVFDDFGVAARDRHARAFAPRAAMARTSLPESPSAARLREHK